MKKYFAHIIVLFLIFSQCKKKDGQVEPHTNTEITETKVKEIKLDSTVNLIYPAAEKLLMAQGEVADINAQSMSNKGLSEITYASSDPSVAQVSDGKITAVANGTCIITGTNAKGSEVSIEVNVQD